MFVDEKVGEEGGLRWEYSLRFLAVTALPCQPHAFHIPTVEACDSFTNRSFQLLCRYMSVYWWEQISPRCVYFCLLPKGKNCLKPSWRNRAGDRGWSNCCRRTLRRWLPGSLL